MQQTQQISLSRSRPRATAASLEESWLAPERIRRAAILAATAASALALLAGVTSVAGAQELRGSKASVEKMYAFAVNHGLQFYRTPEDVSAAAQRGRLMQLAGGPGWELSTGVGWAYATPEAVAFLDQLGPEYVQSCQAPMVVTSATRPLSRKPRNGVANSVHPAGIAVDLRKPYRGPCLDWLRKRLSELESSGRIEATEERHPPHFHIAVLSRPGSALPRSLAARMASAEAVARQLGTSPDRPWSPGAALPRPAGPGRAFQIQMLSPFARRDMPRLAGVVVLAQSPAAVASAAPAAGDSLVRSVATGSVAVATADGETYVVRPGDTAWEIAKRHGITVDQLLSANKLGKRATIRPKMELKIPAAKAAN